MYDDVIVPTMLYSAVTSRLREVERRRLDVIETSCLNVMVGVTQMDRIKNEEVLRLAGTKEKLITEMDRKLLR